MWLNKKPAENQRVFLHVPGGYDLSNFLDDFQVVRMLTKANRVF